MSDMNLQEKTNERIKRDENYTYRSGIFWTAMMLAIVVVSLTIGCMWYLDEITIEKKAITYFQLGMSIIFLIAAMTLVYFYEKNEKHKLNGEYTFKQKSISALIALGVALSIGLLTHFIIFQKIAWTALFLGAYVAFSIFWFTRRRTLWTFSIIIGLVMGTALYWLAVYDNATILKLLGS